MEHYKIIQSYNEVTLISMQKSFELIPSFEWVSFPKMKKRLYRHMIYTPDFIISINGIDKPIAVESKGFARKDYNIRKKIFIKEYGNEYYFYESNSIKDLINMIEEVLKCVKE